MVKALALGARAVLLGRATLYGLAALGEEGATDVLRILRQEIDTTLALIGCARAADLSPAFIQNGGMAGPRPDPMTYPKLTIRGLQVRAVDAPLANPIRTAVGEVPSAPLVLIDISTEEGVTGRSYLFAYTPVTLRSLVHLIQDLEPELVGKTVASFERMRQLEMRFRLVGWQGLVGMAVGAIDMALWDALGCAVNLPVVSLLGGEVRGLPAYDSYGIIDLRRRLGTAGAFVESGFKAIKIKIGGEVLKRM